MIAAIKRWGWVVAFVIAGGLIWFFTFGRKKPDIATEIKAAQAEAKAQKASAEIGRVEAIKQIEVEYKAHIEALDETQRQQATELRADPVKLASFLARVANRKPV